ncbi:sphingosine kinase [Pilimelia anulata]|uniref:Sphingosine kinase n=1 Tax=Pilimelia anulata TaxID=53371 RepID=A0A8J3F917_9ACTN|nr:diacylglycerol kinase family protein [Pilimelia anulata]GGJ83156.1 sphingosine kinase [Pilimelia anulata]
MAVAEGDRRTNPAPRSAVVVNPSKVEDLDHLRHTVEDVLSRAGWPPPRWFETSAADPGLGQARDAVESGAEVVFVCGGDGTVMSAVSALVGTEVSMAVLPAGTGNLLAANLGLATDLGAGLAVALEGGLRRLDVGRVEGRHFVVMAGMGFDAHMLDATSDTAKARIGWPAYVLGAVKHLQDRPIRVTVRVDGAAPVRRRARSVLVANVGRLQGGVPLFSEAQPDDGVLDIAILTPNTLRKWIALGWGLVRRRKGVPSIEFFRGARVEVTSDRPQPRQLDGDLVEASDRLVVEVVPQALLLCVPRPAESPDLAARADAAAKPA